MCFKIINVEVEVCEEIIIDLHEKFWYILRCGWVGALSVCVVGSAGWLALCRWGGGACWLCPKSRALRLHASSSEVYPTGKLQ